VYRAHVATVHRYLASRVGFEMGEELTAQTFVEAWARRDAFDPERGSQVAWLLGIATNVLRHHLRQERRRARAHMALAAQRRFTTLADSLQDEVSDAMSTVERTAAVQVALGQVDGADREVLVLAAQPDVTYRAIAEHLGIPVGTVRSRLSRARRRLAAEVNSL